MENIVAIIAYTVKQHVRHKIYLTVILFGMVLIAGSIVLSSLSTGRIRMLTNLGLSSTEFIALVTIIFATVNLILEEMESRTIYLILTHSLEKWEYIMGRYLGTVISVIISMFLMMVMHLAVLFISGWEWGNYYMIAWLFSVGKIIVMSAATLMISLFTTSAAASMSFSLLLWIMGHFSQELKFLAEKSPNLIIKAAVGVIYRVTPNFSYYNYRDFWYASNVPGTGWFVWVFVYTAAYAGVCLIISNFLFSQKEF